MIGETIKIGDVIILRKNQQIGLPGNWECTSGVIVVVNLNVDVVAFAVPGEVVAVPPGYAIESLIPGSGIRWAASRPDPAHHYAFVYMRSKHIKERVRLVQKHLAGRWLQPTAMCRILGCCRETAGRAYAWKSARDGG